MSKNKPVKLRTYRIKIPNPGYNPISSIHSFQLGMPTSASPHASIDVQAYSYTIDYGESLTLWAAPESKMCNCHGAFNENRSFYTFARGQWLEIEEINNG